MFNLGRVYKLFCVAFFVFKNLNSDVWIFLSPFFLNSLSLPLFLNSLSRFVFHLCNTSEAPSTKMCNTTRFFVKMAQRKMGQLSTQSLPLFIFWFCSLLHVVLYCLVWSVVSFFLSFTLFYVIFCSWVTEDVRYARCTWCPTRWWHRGDRHAPYTRPTPTPEET